MYKDYELDNGSSVHVTWAKKKGKKEHYPLTVTGYPIDKECKKIAGGKLVRRTAHSDKELDEVIQEVVKTVEKSMKKSGASVKKVPVANGFLDQESPWVKGFNEIEANKEDYFSWAPTTMKNYFAYFRLNILPRIQHCHEEGDFSDDMLDELKKDLLEKSLSNKNSYGNAVRANAKIVTMIEAAQKIIDAIRDGHPELPEIQLAVKDLKIKVIQTEQLKLLPFNVILNFREQVEEILETKPKLARAAAIMESGALRTGEAAAASQEDTIDCNGVVVIKVCAQDNNGLRDSRLKTEAAYRVVILDKWGSEIVLRANELIGPEDELHSPLAEAELSSWVKNALFNAGVDKDAFRTLLPEWTKNPDRDSNGIPIVADVTAYCLRRSRVTIWEHICGISREIIDYMIGHSRKYLKNTKRIHILDPVFLQAVARQVLRFDLDAWTHPDYNGEMISIEDNSPPPIIPMDVTTIVNHTDRPIHLKLKVTAAEPGETITITSKSEIVNWQDLPTEKEKGKRSNTCIIGMYEARTELEGGNKNAE